MKTVPMKRIVEIYGALEFFTEQNTKNPNAPPQLVKGNIGYLPLSFRVSTAKKLLQPLMDSFNETRKPLLEQAKVPLTAEDDVPEGQFKVSVAKLTELSKPLMDEEVSMPDLKPLTWQLLEKAGVYIDPAIVIMLGDFLEGEPTEVETPAIHTPGLLPDTKHVGV